MSERACACTLHYIHYIHDTHYPQYTRYTRYTHYIHACTNYMSLHHITIASTSKSTSTFTNKTYIQMHSSKHPHINTHTYIYLDRFVHAYVHAGVYERTVCGAAFPFSRRCIVLKRRKRHSSETVVSSSTIASHVQEHFHATLSPFCLRFRGHQDAHPRVEHLRVVVYNRKRLCPKRTARSWSRIFERAVPSYSKPWWHSFRERQS